MKKNKQKWLVSTAMQNKAENKLSKAFDRGNEFVINKMRETILRSSNEEDNKTI